MRYRFISAISLACLSLLWLLSFPAAGQYREYYFYGKVVDTDKKPIPDVEIFLQDEETSRRYTAKTDKNGDFKLAGLPHGIYNVTVRKQGYQSFQDKWSFEAPQERMQKVEIQTIVLATEEKIKAMEQAKEALSLFNEVTEKLRQGDFEGAAAVLDKMMARNPNDANAHYLLGIVYLQKKMLPEAMAEFTKTMELAPSFAEAYHQLGLCYQQQKEPEKALEVYKKAAELDPRSVDSFYNTGLILFELSRIPEALNCFEKALELKPDEPEFLEMAGRCYIHQRDYSRAIDYLEKAKKGYSNQEKIEFLEQLITKLKELQKQ